MGERRGDAAGAAEIASATSLPASSGVSAGMPSYCSVGEIIGVRTSGIEIVVKRMPSASVSAWTASENASSAAFEAM